MNPRKIKAAVLFAALGCTAAMRAAPAIPGDEPGQKRVADAPPVTVKTVPAAGAEDVDAEKVREVRVTFSKPMAAKSWSWATDPRYGAEVEPAGEIRYDPAQTTCVLPVKLKPKSTYAVWLNTDRFQNFRDAAGTAAVPYLLVFRTK